MAFPHIKRQTIHNKKHLISFTRLLIYPQTEIASHVEVRPLIRLHPLVNTRTYTLHVTTHSNTTKVEITLYIHL